MGLMSSGQFFGPGGKCLDWPDSNGREEVGLKLQLRLRLEVAGGWEPKDEWGLCLQDNSLAQVVSVWTGLIPRMTFQARRRESDNNEFICRAEVPGARVCV